MPPRGLAALLGHCPSLCPTPLVTPLGVPPAAIPVCSAALSIIHHQTAAPQQPLLEEVTPHPPPQCPSPARAEAQATPLQRLDWAGLGSLPLSGQHMARLEKEQLTPYAPQDLETLVARDHDLQQLRQGLVVPAAQPPLSWHQRKEAFHNYLHLVCSPALLVGVGPPHPPSPAPPLPSASAHPPARLCSQGTHSGTEIRQQGTVTLPMERETETWDVCALPRAAPSLGEAGVCTEVPTVLTTLPPQDLRALGPGKARQPQVSLPIPPTRRGVHSKASQVRPLAPPTLCPDLVTLPSAL